MWLNSSKKHSASDQDEAPDSLSRLPVRPERHWSRLLIVPAWVLLSFIAAQVAVVGVLNGLTKVGVSFPGISTTTLNTIVSVVVYGLTLLIVIGIPYWVKKIRTSREELGITRLPSWSDILLAPAGLFVYLLLTGVLSALAMQFLPFYDVNEVQNTGYGEFNARYEYVLAFFSLVVLAPVAEEIVFRGYLLGKLRKHVPVWVAVVATSLIFALAHGAWNVGVDVFALSLVLCTLRIVSGSLWAPILLHMIKNAIAFYLLFINPIL